MTTYKAVMDGAVLASGGLTEAKAALAQGLTSLMAQDPVSASVGVMQANQAATSGVMDQALARGGSYRIFVEVNGQMVQASIIREE